MTNGKKCIGTDLGAANNSALVADLVVFMLGLGLCTHWKYHNV